MAPASGIIKALKAFAASRHNQRKADFFVVEGLRCCREALQRRPQWCTAAVFSESAFRPGGAGAELSGVLSSQCNIHPVVIPDGEFAQLAMTEGTQGVLCVMKKPMAKQPAALSPVCTLILDQVQEPGNVGTILRTAWALGMTQVWMTGGSADPWSPKVVRSGMGAQFALTCHSFPDLASAIECYHALGGTDVWCAMMSSDVTLYSPSFTAAGSAIVMGNEGNGITRPELGQAVTIPMPGHAESLNVAQAATLLMFEAWRRLQAPNA